MHSDKTKILLSINELNRQEQFLARNQDFAVIITELQHISPRIGIRLALVHEKTLILVLDDMTQKQHAAGLVSLLRTYHVEFLDKEHFGDYLLRNTALQKEHVILFNIHHHLAVMEDLQGQILINGPSALSASKKKIV